MKDISILNETFNLYYKKAKECLEKGDKMLAKRYYLLAAEQMLNMAKETKGELQKARYERAKSIIQFADSIQKEPKPVEKNKEVTNDIKVIKNEKVSLEEALKQLDELIGLEKVKNQVHDWIDQIKVFKMRKERNMSIPDMSYHLVFTGNPGTGKTTVARLMASIYAALGILSEGQLVEVDRQELVAGYVGQTALKTQAVLDKAYGGVLFIDEAYSLANKGATDFGNEAIDTILKDMEDKRDNLVVIIAGYENLMEKFIQSNPGLRSRFKNYIHFEDYNGDDLYQIFINLCDKNQYVLEPAAKAVLKQYFDDLYQNRDRNFGNGRDVRNLFENIITNQSKRIARLKEISNEEIALIRVQDLNINISRKDNNIPREERVDHNDKNSKPEDKVLDENYNTDNSLFKFNWDQLPTIKFDDIAGLEEVKNVVKVKVLLPLQEPKAFEGYVRKSGGGLFLYGPPGTGKTMIAAAIANEIHAKFCSVKPSDLLNQGAGNTEKAVRALFSQAREFPCAVIYFDEMDAISPKNTKSQYAKQLRSELLAQLQGIEEYGKKSNNILFCIAATNKPWDVDSAFIRPGRFGNRVYVGLPDNDARKYMLELRLKKLKAKGIVEVIDDIDIDALVERMNGFNGSDISNFLDQVEERSALRAIGGTKKYINMNDFTSILETFSSSVQKEDIEKLLEWKQMNDRSGN